MSYTKRFLEDHPDAPSFEEAVHTATCRCSEELKRHAELRAQPAPMPSPVPANDAVQEEKRRNLARVLLDAQWFVSRNSDGSDVMRLLNRLVDAVVDNYFLASRSSVPTTTNEADGPTYLADGSVYFKDRERRETVVVVPELTGCCANCGAKPAINAGPVNDTVCISVKPTCDCIRRGALYSSFNLWPASRSSVIPATDSGEGTMASAGTASPTQHNVTLALHEAVTAIYFMDSSDYHSALWAVVRALNPDYAERLETDEAGRVYQESLDALNASEQLRAQPAPEVLEAAPDVCDPDCDSTGTYQYPGWHLDEGRDDGAMSG